MPTLRPVDYTSKDYDGFRGSMLSYASVVYPEWTGRSRADFGVALIELFAYMGDILSYYGDRVAREAFISTASQRASLLSHAALLGYTPYGFVASTGTVTFKTDLNQATAVTVPAGTKVATDFIANYDTALTFETDTDVVVPATGGTASVAITQGTTVGATSKVLSAGTASQTNLSVTQIGTSDGSMDQIFRLPDAPAIEGSVRIFLDDTASSNPLAITELFRTTSLLSSSPGERVYASSVDETSATVITLGDGVNGYIPQSGVRLYARYRVGGGRRGNLDANQIKNFVTSVVGVTVAASSTTTGGADAESNDSIRSNAPKSFRVQNRAVTLQDYADLAMAVPGVTKSRATADSMTSIRLSLVGPVGEAPTATLLASVQTVMDEKAAAGATVTLSGGIKVYVNLGTSLTPVRVGVYRHFVTTDVQASVESAIINLFRNENTDLGMRIPVSAVYAAASRVPGVAYVVIPVMARSTDAQTSANDVLCRDWEFPVIGNIYVTAESAQA